MNSERIDFLYREYIVHEELPVDFQIGMQRFLEALKKDMTQAPATATPPADIKEGPGEGADWIEELIDIRNKLYNDLPTGDVKAWDLIQAIKWHCNSLDNFMHRYSEAYASTKEAVQPEGEKTIMMEKLFEALIESEAGLEFAGADKKINKTEFIPSPTLALRKVRQVIEDYNLFKLREQAVERHVIFDCINADAPYEDMSEEFKTGFDFCLPNLIGPPFH